MSIQNEAYRDWRVEPCDNPAGWWTVGYIYDGHELDKRGFSRNGEFVPIHHWAGRLEADVYRDALLEGDSREEAKAKALAA